MHCREGGNKTVNLEPEAKPYFERAGTGTLLTCFLPRVSPPVIREDKLLKDQDTKSLTEAQQPGYKQPLNPKENLLKSGCYGSHGVLHEVSAVDMVVRRM